VAEAGVVNGGVELAVFSAIYKVLKLYYQSLAFPPIPTPPLPVALLASPPPRQILCRHSDSYLIFGSLVLIETEGVAFPLNFLNSLELQVNDTN
jgi:hypothetical protein